MDLATQILVIIVSSVLAIFLVAGIVVSVLTAKLLKELRLLIARAEQLADSAAQIGEIFKDTSGPLALVKLIRNIINSFHKK